MSFINANTRKLNLLVEKLVMVDKRQTFDLIIGSCYFKIDACLDLIRVVKRRVKLKGVYIYIDRRTAIQIGTVNLRELRSNSSVLIKIHAIQSGSLFHTKGYCLVPSSKEVQYSKGRLVIGSANLTGAGLIKQQSNIESAIATSDEEDIRNFVKFFEDERNLISIEDILKFDNDGDLVYLKYATLLMGWFSRKWTGNLNRFFTKRYALNTIGLERTSGDFEALGFIIRAASIGKSYFKFDMTEYRPFRRNLIMNYGIECSIGDWVPQKAISSGTKDQSEIERFRGDLDRKLSKERNRISRQIQQDYLNLLDLGIIDKVKVDPIQSFWNSIDNLLSNDMLLGRYLYSRTFFDFPYDLIREDKIDEIYDELYDVADGKSRKNAAQRAFVLSRKNRKIEPIDMITIR